MSSVHGNADARHRASGLPHRATLLEHLRSGDAHYDLIVVGGGITGAGILREAARRGIKALLVEQRDFAWGTSSRSSKMVHGGLRYLAGGQYKLARDAVRERERLLVEAPGLVDPLPFIMPHYRRQFPGPRLFGGLLWLYDRLAGRRNHAFYPAAQLLQWVPGLAQQGLLGASWFADAVTDDARLVLRVLQEAGHAGADALNYVQAQGLIRQDGQVRGVELHDVQSGANFPVHADLVVNASGAWSDTLRAQLGHAHSIRPLRGSHLVVPFWRLPVACSVSLFHPEDRRPVFLFPWEGVTVIGTTDLDHGDSLDEDAQITNAEVDYLLALVAQVFPQARIGRTDVQSCWAGVRPVVRAQKAETAAPGRDKVPSSEKREHALWNDQGMISVAGGKLTTFRLIALEVLTLGQQYLRQSINISADERIFSCAPTSLKRPAGITAQQWRRLQGHHGRDLADVLVAGPLEAVANTDTLWAELVWAASAESVEHLDDLLLRRTRLGLLLPEGARSILPRLRVLCGPALGWSDSRWEEECERYLELWRRAYYLPEDKREVPV